MALVLSEEDRRDLEELLRSAEPYPEGAPELEMFDGEADDNRLMATLAKAILDGRLE